MENLVFIGLALVLIGVFVIIMGSLLSGGSGAKIAVGGFIGPIPFGFGNDRNMVVLSIAISAIIILFFLLSYRLW